VHPTKPPFPGDEVIPTARLVMDRELTLAGPPDAVWPWLEQLGKGRAGWYLPHAAERLLPRSRRAARTVQPHWLGLRPGDRIPDYGPGDPWFEVRQISRPEHLVLFSERSRLRGGRPPLRLTWALLLSPIDGGRSHLHLRLRVDLGKAPGPLATYGGGALDLATVRLLERGLNERLRAAP